MVMLSSAGNCLTLCKAEHDGPVAALGQCMHAAGRAFEPFGGPSQGAVWSCVLNGSAMLAATASADFSARVWDAISGDELHCLQHAHIARCLAFGDAAQRLVTGGAQGPAAA